MSRAAGFLLRKIDRKKMAKISLWDSTIKTSIDEMRKTLSGINSQKITTLNFFEFNVMKQLILPNCRSCYSTFVSIEEVMLLFKPL